MMRKIGKEEQNRIGTAHGSVKTDPINAVAWILEVEQHIFILEVEQHIFSFYFKK